MAVDHVLDDVEAALGETHDDLATVVGPRSLDEPALFEPVDAIRDRPVVTIVWRTSSPAVSSYGSPPRRNVASTSYIQLSMS